MRRYEPGRLHSASPASGYRIHGPLRLAMQGSAPHFRLTVAIIRGNRLDFETRVRRR